MTGSFVRVARKTLRISTCSSAADERGSDERGSWVSLLLPPDTLYCPGSSYCTLSSCPSQGFSNIPQMAEVMKGTPHLPQLGRVLNSQPRTRSRIFHCLAP